MHITPLKQQHLSPLSSSMPVPKYDRSSIKAGIVHVGVGGFHRSHQAYYMHQLLGAGQHAAWGICGIGIREADQQMNQVLQKQDCLYTLMTQHPDGEVRCEVIGSLLEYIFAVNAPKEAIEKMAHPDTKIISLTITEGGYHCNPNTGMFDFDHPDVQHDLEQPHHPKTIFGYLTAALQLRRERALPAVTILSCDNIQHNGEVARKMLLAFAQKQNPELAHWIEEELSFPNTMVDRITPVTTDTAIKYLKNNFQLNDEWPVVCEPYIQWIIEDNFSNGRPPLETLGVQFVPDVSPYEKMKIRLLNAGHSVLGIPGAIHGHATINDCMEDQVFASFMRQFMDREVTSLLGDMEGIDLTVYKDSLEARFANPNIKDSVSRICSESSAKLPKFLIPTIQENLRHGGSIKYGTFILAAWCYYCAKQVDLKQQEIEIIDERKEELQHSANGYKEDRLSFLRIADIFGDLLQSERFTTEYSKMLKAIFEEPDVRSHMVALMSQGHGTIE